MCENNIKGEVNEVNSDRDGLAAQSSCSELGDDVGLKPECL